MPRDALRTAEQYARIGSCERTERHGLHALGVAAAHKRRTGSRIGVIISGGNVDLIRFAELLGD